MIFKNDAVYLKFFNTYVSILTQPLENGK